MSILASCKILPTETESPRRRCDQGHRLSEELLEHLAKKGHRKTPNSLSGNVLLSEATNNAARPPEQLQNKSPSLPKYT